MCGVNNDNIYGNYLQKCLFSIWQLSWLWRKCGCGKRVKKCRNIVSTLTASRWEMTNTVELEKEKEKQNESLNNAINGLSLIAIDEWR